jgi:segregation and condensation protein A
MSIRVQLQQFEGPLDLLLYLIRKEEMDIFNINVVEITKQYLDYIKLMKEFDIEVAGDFIAMASTLIHIKSKMLLPQYDENGEIVDQEDPRKVLVQKLLEYEKYKEAAKSLYERPLLNRDLWARGFREKIEFKDDEIELEENALFSLIGSFRKTMKSMYKRVHKVNVKLQSIANRIMEMKHKLIVGKQVSMSELFNTSITDVKEKSRNILITFLSLLELGKMELVHIYQTENYGEIYINTKKEIDDDVVSKAENYDNINADSIALNLIQRNNDVLTEEEVEEIEANTQFELTENLEDPALIAVADVELTEDMATDEELWAAEAELNSPIVSSDEAPFELAIEPEPETEYIAVTEIEPEPEAEA